MKKTFNKICNFIKKKENRLLFLILSLAGVITNCNDDSNNVEPMYGAPNADFIINGKVKSSAAQQPINNIQLIMRNDTAFTNENGEFIIKNNGSPQDTIFKLTIKDIDGNANGTFQPQEVTVTFPANSFVGGDGNWYLGKVEKNIDLVLEEAK